MQSLGSMKCEACQVGAPLLTEDQLATWMPQITGWEITEQQGIKRLERTFKFSNFAEALDFTRKVGALAESQGHHPRIVTEWGRVKVTWWTHKIRGLHQNDVIMAARTDTLIQTPGLA